MANRMGGTLPVNAPIAIFHNVTTSSHWNVRVAFRSKHVTSPTEASISAVDSREALAYKVYWSARGVQEEFSANLSIDAHEEVGGGIIGVCKTCMVELSAPFWAQWAGHFARPAAGRIDGSRRGWR